LSKYHLSGEEVRRIRRKLKETQAEFAERLDVDAVTVARWETNQRKCVGLYAKTIAALDKKDSVRREASMYINLIPSSESGISYGIDTMIEAVRRYRSYLLAAIRLIAGEDPNNTSNQTFILLFREPGSIGMITGFINDSGTNIKYSGTGGHYGEEMVKCLEEHGIKPMMGSMDKLTHSYPELFKDTDRDSVVDRLPFWRNFIEREIITNLHSTAYGFLSMESYTGSWEESWQAEDS
jgi:transcriptional regulator with XRE-family HTH domain